MKNIEFMRPWWRLGAESYIKHIATEVLIDEQHPIKKNEAITPFTYPFGKSIAAVADKEWTKITTARKFFLPFLSHNAGRMKEPPA